MSQIKDLLGDSVIYGIGGLLLKGTQVLILPLILFYLEPQEFGTLDYFLNIKNILLIVYGWGVMTTIFKFSEKESFDKSPFNGFLVTMTIIGISSVVLSLLPFFFEQVYEFKENLLFVHLIASFGALMTIPLGIFRQKRKPVDYILVNVLYTVIFIGVSYLIVSQTSLNYKSILWGHVLGTTTAFFYGAVRVRKFIAFRYSSDLFKRMFFFGLSILMNQMAFVVILGLTRFVLKSNGTFEDVGILGMAFRLSLFVGALLIAPFSLAWLPFVTANKDKVNFNITLSDTFRIFSWVGLFFCFSLEVLLKDVFLLIENKEYLGAVKYVLPFSLSFFTQGLYFIFSAGIFLSGNLKQYRIIAIAGTVFNILLYLIFIDRINILTVSLITLLSFIWMMVLSYHYGNRILKIDVFQWKNATIFLFYTLLFVLFYSLPETYYFALNIFLLKITVLIILLVSHIIIEKNLINNR